MSRLVTKQSNLKKANPKLAKEWHPTKNKDLKPLDVLPNSKKIVWWKCKKRHVWQAPVYSRTNGTGCPICAKKHPSKKGKDLPGTREHEIKNLQLSRHVFECS